VKRIKNTLGRNLKKKRTKDKISPEQRSENMSKIRSRGTKFEKDFIKIINKEIDENYILNCKDLKGKPDIVFKDKRIVIFLDSDFWHGWQFPRWKHLMKNNFWVSKIEKNRKRDRNVTFFLRRKGWVVVRIWEHNIKKNIKKELERIKSVLSN